jgi:hypothetical protein
VNVPDDGSNDGTGEGNDAGPGSNPGDGEAAPAGPEGLAKFESAPSPDLAESGTCSAIPLSEGSAYPAKSWHALVDEAQSLGLAEASTLPGCVDQIWTRGVLTSQTTLTPEGQPLEERQWSDDGKPISIVSHVYEQGREVARETWTEGHEAVSESWTYDASGWLVSRTTASSREARIYGDGHRLERIESFNGDKLANLVELTYDDQGRPSALSWTLEPDGIVWARSEASYHPTGELASLHFVTGSFPNEIDVSESFDTAGRQTFRGSGRGSTDFAYPGDKDFDVEAQHLNGYTNTQDTRVLRWGVLGGPRPLHASNTHVSDGGGAPFDAGFVYARIYDESGRLWIETLDKNDDCHPELTRTLRYDSDGVLREERSVDADGTLILLRTIQGASCPAKAEADSATDFDGPLTAPSQAELIDRLLAGPR